MTRAFTVRPLRPDEDREAAASAARAFWHDPLFDYFSRDLFHEHQALAHLMRPLIGDGRSAGDVWTAAVEGRPRAVAVWFRPGTHRRDRTRDLNFARRALPGLVGARHLRTVGRLFAKVEQHHPHDEHWYLSLLAVDPALQGNGAGGALLAELHERADGEGLPCYLETQKEANVAYYGRFGYEVEEVIRLGPAPPMWTMRRPAR